MLGLDQLIGGTFSRPKVATDPWYIFNRPRVVHFRWPPRHKIIPAIDTYSQHFAFLTQGDPHDN